MRISSRLPVAEVLFFAVLLLWIAGLAGLWTLPGIAQWTVGLLYVAYDTWLIAFVALELRDRFTAPGAQAGAAPAGPITPAPPQSVAVLISARNEGHSLPATLDALLRQHDPPDEIWVIDDGSEDDTHAVLSRRYGLRLLAPQVPARSAMHPRLCALSKPNSGKADSLNRGIGLITSELVITLDADTVMHPDAVGAMRRGFSREAQLVAAGGVLTPRCGPGISGRLFEWFQTFEYLRSFIARVAWMRLDALLLVSGAFACYRRDALLKVGCLDTGSWVEDYELIHRLHRYAGEHGLAWRVGVLPEAAAVTDAPGTLGAFMRQRRRWFGGFLQTLYRYRDMVGNPRYAALGRLMLPVKVLDTLQPIFGITAFLLLLDFAWRRERVLTPVLLVIGVKLIIDFVFLLWGVAFYNRWQGRQSTPREWLLAGLAALTEPFCFQVMRHCGATLGWLAVLRQRVDWVPQRPHSGAGGERGSMRYTRTAMFLHWLIALAIAINVGLALSVDYLPDGAVRPVIDAHKSIGITVLGLALIRLLWRFSHVPPPLAAGMAAWERRGAHAAHAILYGLMLALPLSGWLHDSAWKDAATHPMRLFGLLPWPRIHAISMLDPASKEPLHTIFGHVHTWLADALYVLFVLHVGGALKHQLLDRQPELQRMLPPSGRGT
jgi:cellulose synthase/poly-beta-1,6-N-acetylglucosamine synthase-like glycosyltransferase/cytochrome b561